MTDNGHGLNDLKSRRRIKYIEIIIPRRAL